MELYPESHREWKKEGEIARGGMLLSLEGERKERGVKSICIQLSPVPPVMSALALCKQQGSRLFPRLRPPSFECLFFYLFNLLSCWSFSVMLHSKRLVSTDVSLDKHLFEGFCLFGMARVRGRVATGSCYCSAHTPRLNKPTAATVFSMTTHQPKLNTSWKNKKRTGSRLQRFHYEVVGGTRVMSAHSSYTHHCTHTCITNSLRGGWVCVWSFTEGR